MPADDQVLARVKPIYAEFEGWQTPLDKVKRYKDLPLKTRRYLRAITELTGARLAIASVGPARAQTIFV